jgi:hypothetical protein
MTAEQKVSELEAALEIADRRMLKAEAKEAKFEAALKSLLAKCPNCGGAGEVATGVIQGNVPPLVPCGICAGERAILNSKQEKK